MGGEKAFSHKMEILKVMLINSSGLKGSEMLRFGVIGILVNF